MFCLGCVSTLYPEPKPTSFGNNLMHQPVLSRCEQTSVNSLFILYIVVLRSKPYTITTTLHISFNVKLRHHLEVERVLQKTMTSLRPNLAERLESLLATVTVVVQI